MITCHFAYDREHGIEFESVQVPRARLTYDSEHHRHVFRGPALGWTFPEEKDIILPDIIVSTAFDHPIVKERPRLITSVCCSVRENVIHGVWLAYNKCDAARLRTVFRDYWDRITLGAEARGFIFYENVACHVWDQYVRAVVVSNTLMDVHYVQYRVNFVLSPRRIHYMGEHVNGEREFGVVYVDPNARDEWFGAVLVLRGRHETSADVPLRHITVVKMSETQFRIDHPHFSRYARCVFTHHESFDNVYEIQTEANPTASFDDVAAFITERCDKRRQLARDAYYVEVKQQIVDDSTQPSCISPSREKE